MNVQPDTAASVARARARRGLLLFLPLVAVFDVVLTGVIVSTGNTSWILALMWSAAAASVICRLVLREGFRDVSFRFGGIRTLVFVVVGLIFPIIVGFIAYGTAWVTGLATFSPPPEGFLSGLLVAATVTTALSAVSATGEEIGWRGYMLTRLIEAGVPFPLLVSGLIWGLWHIPLILTGLYVASPDQPRLLAALLFMLLATSMGVVIGHFRLETGSIWPAIAVHAAWNSVIKHAFDPATTGTDAALWIGEGGFLVVLAVAVAAALMSLREPRMFSSPGDPISAPRSVWVQQRGPDRRVRPLWRRLSALVSVLVVAVVGFTACSGTMSKSSSQPEPVGAAASPVASYADAPCPDPLLFGMSELKLGAEFSCGVLTVPEDRSAPTGRTVQIPVAVLRSESSPAKSDPIVYLAGGPGGSGLLEAPGTKGWNADRDVIFVGQRGTLHTTPALTCSEIDAFKAGTAGVRIEDASVKAANDQAVAACRNRLVADGTDLSDFNTTENAADIAALRTAMGINEWNVYGISYGTSLAQQLVRDHPEGIRTVILDGVVPPSFNVVQDWQSAAYGYEQLFAACAAQPACASEFPDLAGEFSRLVNELTANPKTVSVDDPASGGRTDVVIDGYKLADLVIGGSADSTLRSELPLIIHELARGDGTRAAEALLPGHAPQGAFGYGLLYGVQCAEYVPFTSQAELVSVGQQALPDFPASVLQFLPQVPFVFSNCGVWDVAKADTHATANVHTSLPVLLVSGSLDAITPPTSAELVAQNMPNAHQLTFPGMGHGVAVQSPECFTTVMNGFLNSPQAFDQACVLAITVAPFVT